MDAHTKNLEDSQRLQARANSSLELMQASVLVLVVQIGVRVRELAIRVRLRLFRLRFSALPTLSASSRAGDLGGILSLRHRRSSHHVLHERAARGQQFSVARRDAVGLVRGAYGCLEPNAQRRNPNNLAI